MSATTERPSTVVPLSRREAESLRLGALGLTDKESADRMGVGLPTVRMYRKRTQRKLRAKGTVQAMLVAWRLGLLDLEAVADEVAAGAGWSGDPERGR